MQFKKSIQQSCYWDHFCQLDLLLKKRGEGALVSVMLPSICSALFCPQQVYQRTAPFRRQPSPTLWDFTDKPEVTTGPGTWCVAHPHRSDHNTAVSSQVHFLDLKKQIQGLSLFMQVQHTVNTGIMKLVSVGTVHIAGCLMPTSRRYTWKCLTLRVDEEHLNAPLVLHGAARFWKNIHNYSQFY